VSKKEENKVKSKVKVRRRRTLKFGVQRKDELTKGLAGGEHMFSQRVSDVLVLLSPLC